MSLLSAVQACARRIIVPAQGTAARRCTVASVQQWRAFSVRTSAVRCAGSSSPDQDTVTLTPAQVDEAARLLGEARVANTTLDFGSATPDWMPRTHADMYAVQDAVIELPHNRGKLVGWKVGATNSGTQQRLGLPGPFAGPVFESDVVSLPAVDYGADDSKASSPELPPGVSPVYTIDTSAGTIRGVEAEFAVVLGKTLTPIEDVAFTIPEVSGAIDEVVPVIEVVGTRNKGDLAANVPLLVADHGGHDRLLLSAMRHEGAMVEWPSVSVRMFLNGDMVGDGDCEDALGHPFVSLCWLANHLRNRGHTLEKGHIVATGTVTGLTAVTAGDVLYATFDAYAKFGVVGPAKVV